jgi:hypothetical protein
MPPHPAPGEVPGAPAPPYPQSPSTARSPCEPAPGAPAYPQPPSTAPSLPEPAPGAPASWPSPPAALSAPGIRASVPPTARALGENEPERPPAGGQPVSAAAQASRPLKPAAPKMPATTRATSLDPAATNSAASTEPATRPLPPTTRPPAGGAGAVSAPGPRAGDSPPGNRPGACRRGAVPALTAPPRERSRKWRQANPLPPLDACSHAAYSYTYATPLALRSQHLPPQESAPRPVRNRTCERSPHRPGGRPNPRRRPNPCCGSPCVALPKVPRGCRAAAPRCHMARRGDMEAEQNGIGGHGRQATPRV